MTKFLTILIFVFLTHNLSAQNSETIDSVFKDFVLSNYFGQTTDSLPNLFYKDSILFNYSDIISIKRITQEDELPISVIKEKIKFFDWNSIPDKASTERIQIKSEQKLFSKYEIKILIPLIKPTGHKRKNSECCEDTHYICVGKYSVKEKNDTTEFTLMDCYTYLNKVCILYL